MKMSKIDGSDALAMINSKIVQDDQTLPQVKLKDGSQVQTGTVATMLYNIQRYNKGERGAVETELSTAIPTLVKVGLFDLFTAEEWIQGNNPGRRFVGLKAQAFLQKNG
ncbi:hypothetical protein F4V57_07920 [Acinetobacter qingfengensis]|nr:hypothetical protein F4V57_07920 [Acinetobacter qingfengensis]